MYYQLIILLKVLLLKINYFCIFKIRDNNILTSYSFSSIINIPSSSFLKSFFLSNIYFSIFITHFSFSFFFIIFYKTFICISIFIYNNIFVYSSYFTISYFITYSFSWILFLIFVNLFFKIILILTQFIINILKDKKIIYFFYFIYF